MIQQLRPATLADLYPLWLWANEGSVDPPLISWPAHVTWFRKQPERSVLIATASFGQPLGTVRIKPGGQVAWTVAPEVRGRGVGSAMVRAAAKKWAHREPWARVPKADVASLKIAQGAGLRVEVLP